MSELSFGPETVRPFGDGIVLAHEVLGERETALRQYIGSIVLRVAGGEELRGANEQPYHSLLDGIKHAKEGEPVAVQMVMSNVMTDTIERTIKAGYISDRVKMEIGQDGELSQHGQSYKSVQANSLRLYYGNALMFNRTKAEMRNAYRLQELIKNKPSPATPDSSPTSRK